MNLSLNIFSLKKLELTLFRAAKVYIIVRKHIDILYRILKITISAKIKYKNTLQYIRFLEIKNDYTYNI